MPALIKGVQRRFIVNLAADTAAKLHERWESLQTAGRSVTRTQLVRDAIEKHLNSGAPSTTSKTAPVVVAASARRSLDKFCRERDGAIEANVVTNALEMYLPEQRWVRQAAERPEILPPVVRAHLRAEVAERAQEFCARTRVPSRWFLEQAVQQLIADSEKDQWRRFLVRVPAGVTAQLSNLTAQASVDAKTVVTRALQSYIARRLSDDADLARRLTGLQRESHAQMPLRFGTQETGRP